MGIILKSLAIGVGGIVIALAFAVSVVIIKSAFQGYHDAMREQEIKRKIKRDKENTKHYE